MIILIFITHHTVINIICFLNRVIIDNRTQTKTKQNIKNTHTRQNNNTKHGNTKGQFKNTIGTQQANTNKHTNKHIEQIRNKHGTTTIT